MITGLSGSGKTVALRALEDSGFYCIDNFPLPLLPELFLFYHKESLRKSLAVGIDIREREFLLRHTKEIINLKKDYPMSVIFLEAEDDVLLRRYKETRRPHPLDVEAKDLREALSIERRLLEPLREMADWIIDTSSYTPHQLRTRIFEAFSPEEVKEFYVTLISFGYKFGLPQQADLLFDIRFLKNPYFVPSLRDKTGLDEEVKCFVLNTEESKVLMEKLRDILLFLIPMYKREGKRSVTIGIGCTGGKHRSPVVVEELRKYLEDHLKVSIKVIHREIE